MAAKHLYVGLRPNQVTQLLYFSLLMENSVIVCMCVCCGLMLPASVTSHYYTVSTPATENNQYACIDSA